MNELFTKTYLGLRTEVRAILDAAQQRGHWAAEHEKVRSFWWIGRALDRFLFKEKPRAKYGTETVRRLSADMGIPRTRLYDMLAFHRAFPIVPMSGQLTWSHYRVLTAIPDATMRQEYTAAALEGQCSVRQLQMQIAAGALESRRNRPALHGRRGTMYTYRSDKYDRYLSDIFYLPGQRDPQRVLDHGRYLNGELVERGAARRMAA